MKSGATRQAQGSHLDVARVLVVEDEPTTAQLIAAKIQSLEGRTTYQVAVCGDALSAIATAVQQPPDICIVDLGIPESKGQDASPDVGRNLISNLSRICDAAILIFTNESRRFDAAEYFEIGAVDYIDKLDGEKFLSIKMDAVWKLLSKARRAVPAEGGSNRKFLISGWLYEQGSRKLLRDRASSEGTRLTLMEDAFLDVILNSDNFDISKEEIYEKVYRRREELGDRSHANMIAGLRRKLPSEIKLENHSRNRYRINADIVKIA